MKKGFLSIIGSGLISLFGCAEDRANMEIHNYKCSMYLDLNGTNEEYIIHVLDIDSNTRSMRDVNIVDSKNPPEFTLSAWDYDHNGIDRIFISGGKCSSANTYKILDNMEIKDLNNNLVSPQERDEIMSLRWIVEDVSKAAVTDRNIISTNYSYTLEDYFREYGRR